MRRIIIRTLREYYQAAPGLTWALMAATVIAGVQPLLDLPIFARLIDSLPEVMEGNWQPVTTAGLQLLAVRLVCVSAIYAANDLTLRLRMTVGITINEQIMRRAATAPLLDLETAAFHDRLTRAMRARGALFNAVSGIMFMLRSLIGAVSVLGVLATLHWAAVLLILAGSVPAWWIQGRSAAAYNTMRKRQAPWLRRVGYLAGLLTGRQYAQEVRLFGLSDHVQHLYTDQMEQIQADQIQVATRQSVLQVAARTSGNVAYVGALALLGMRAVAGGVSIGQFGVMITGLQRVQGLAASVMEALGNLQQDMPAVADIYAFVDQVTPGDAAVVAPRQEAVAVPVVFEGVTFGYPGTAAPTLSDISFRVRPGEVIALVGENGAGKSTLVKLLLGLYRPATGRVTVDGVEIGAPEGEAVRSRIASVFQEYQRYALRAGENIGVGEVGALEDRVRIAGAAAASGADAVIKSLPGGYDTPLRREFEGGQELSGGQWQKLAIARGYMRQASVMVLDEPTAALDPEAELEVFRQFRELVQRKTAFFISHRLGAARLADRIFVLKQGRLVEVGAHPDLMALGGEYAALFGAQAHWYR